MKKLLTSLAVLLSSLLTSSAQFSGSGSGTESDPYLILNPIQLNQLRNFLNQSGVYFKLMANIDLTEFLEDENPDQGWQPVGNSSSAAFKGILDGNGKSIKGLWIKRSPNDYVGFFGYTVGSTIKNVTIEASTIEGKEMVGGISGYSDATTISGCSLTGSVKGSSRIGGFVGGAGDNLTLTGNTAKVIVTGTGNSIGGFVGYNNADYRLVISGCKLDDGVIRGVNNVGGCCGENIGYHRNNNLISNTYIHASIFGADYVGGLCGLSHNDGHTVNLNNCGFVGDIVGSSNVGGLVGKIYKTYNYSYSDNIQKCFAIGNITATGGYVGGLIGADCGYNSQYTNNLSDNYHSGPVTGANNVGGLVGYKLYGEISNCYAIGSVAGARYVGGLLGWQEIQTTIKKSVAINTRVTATMGDVNRVVGYNKGTIGAMGSTDENKSYNRTIVISQGIAQDITDSEVNGTGVSATTLKLKATYVAMGWDFNNTWAIQETECYPYMKSQTAPPVIQSQVISGATTVSGKCVDGGTVTLEIDGVKQQMVSTGHNFSFTVSPLQAGHEVRVSAKADGKEQSYYTTEVVSFLGKGTEADPYQISTAADLTQVYRKGYYKLMNDIDLTNYINQFSPTEGWQSIGRDGSETIHFDGDGHKITGLWCNSTRDNTGLFSCFANGNIKNLAVEVANGKQVKGGANTGILIGKMINGTIENCRVSGKVADGTPVGGIVGLLTGGSISQSHADVTISTTGATSYVGGIVGEISSGTVDRCYTTGRLTATGAESYVGGLIGKNSATVSNCYSTAAVTSSYNAAGVVAYNYRVVDKCYAMGNLFSNNYAAGVIGYNDGANAIVRNCAAMNNKIDVVYESQQVQQGGGYGQRIIGGIKNGAPAPEMNNYALKTMQVSVNDVPQSVYDDIMNGTGKTEAELEQSNTYINLGWNFSEVWGIDEGQMYPYLLWELDVNPVSSISFDKTSILIAVGKSETINASVLPLGATNKRLEWTSSNTEVATVADGVVTAVAVGTATITATSTDGSNISATCEVTVTANHDEAIAALQSIVDRAQALYDNSTEGENVGEYAVGARAELLAVINSVKARISSTMSDEAITQCTNELNAAIELFLSKKVTAGEDTDIAQLDNTIYIERMEAAAGQQIKLSVKMKNSVAVQGYQFDLYLPTGVTVAEDEDGFALAELSTARTTKNKTNYFDFSFTDDGALRVLCGSSKGYTFSGNDGEVAIITLNIAQDIEEGEHPIILKDIRLSDANSVPYRTEYVKSTLAISSYTLGDVNADGAIDVADFIAVANHILGKTPAVFVEKAADANEDGSIDVADFIGVANMILHNSTSSNSRMRTIASAAPRKSPTDIDALDDVIYVEPIIATAGTQQVLSVKMKNTNDVAGFEFSLILPEGITIATDADGMNMVELSTERTTASRTNYFDSSVQADGSLKVLCGTSRENPNTGNLYTFNGNDGEIARITINIPSDYADGDYAVIVKDAILSDAAAVKTTLQPIVETTLTVGESVLVLDENATVPPSAADDVNVLVKRTIKAGEWSTICLPFAMTEAQVKEVFGNDVQLLDFDDYEVLDGGNSINVRFNAINSIEANHPCVIKVTEPVSEFTVDGVDVAPEEEPMINKGSKRKPHAIIGNYVAGTLIENGCLFLSGNEFWYSVGKTKIKALRAYFNFDDLLPEFEDNYAESRMHFVINSETDGINDVNAKAATEALYDLLGRKVADAKQKKGIYVKQGKKVVVK